jgi:hypothetical protein
MREGVWEADRGDCGAWGIPLPGATAHHAPGYGEPDGRCPLCNNSEYWELDKRLLSGVTVKEFCADTGFSVSVVEEHVAVHMLPMYSAALGMVIAIPPLADVALSERLIPVSRALKRAPKILAKRRKELDTDNLDDREGSVSDTAPVAITREYALSGLPGTQERPLRPWPDDRQIQETSDRAVSAINFYDEMMDIRRCAIRVYNEVMESGQLKYYPTAIAAVRERRGIVETLGKMSLIAKQLSESTENEKKLSPALQAVVDSIRKVTPETVESVSEVDVSQDTDVDL